MKKENFDLVVLGSGPGGYVAAIRASQLGMKTALIEKGNLGGVCLNYGCIPTKALIKTSEVVNTLKHDAKGMGITFENFSADYKKNFKRSRVTAAKNSKGVEFLMKKNKISVIKGFGKFNADGEILVHDENNQVTNIVKGKNTIIATGGRARPIPGIDFDGEKILSYHHAILLEELPKDIIIIGGGAIGVEFGYIMKAYDTDVTIVEMLPNLLPTLDKEVAQVVEAAFKKGKIKVKTGTAVKAIDASESGVVVTVEADGKEEKLEAEKALVSIGFAANTENIGLETLGVDTDHGWIKVDEDFKTSVDGIYAIGDVIGNPLLAHAASAEAELCVEKLAGEKTYGYDPLKVPGCIYCQPQVASVGLTEDQAKEQGIEIKVGRFPFSANGKARAIGHPEGLVKLIFDAKYGGLLGAHIAGYDATEMIAELCLAYNMEVTPLELHKTIHAHPTLSEAVAEAALDAEGHALHI